MKECSSQLNESVLTLGSQNAINSLPNKVLLCPFDNLSTQLCLNVKCQCNVFICNQKQCQCQQNHEQCNALNAQRFLTNINKKIISTQFIENFVDDKIQQIIDFLSEFQEQTKLWIKEQHKYFGLNKNEKEFMKSVQMRNFSHIKSNMIWQILNGKEKQKPLDLFKTQNLSGIENHFKKIRESIQNNLEKTIKVIISFEQKIFQNQSSLIYRFSKSGSKSTILTLQKQGKYLQSFFEPIKIKSANLLYRASENDFSALKFHQQCDGIPNTLVLIETQFGKKIGGYTPVEWKTTNFIYVIDESMKTFLFSLTNGEKFKQTKKSNAVVHDSRFGPTFGGGHDLCIMDKANTKASSYARINFIYQNEKYKLDDKQSLQRFTGCKQQKNFKVKQWEVWSLELI